MNTGDSSTPPVGIKLKQCGSKCKRFISEGHDFLRCHSCQMLFHLKCTSFDQEVYSVIKAKQRFDDISWKCQGCKKAPQQPNINDLMVMIASLQERILTLERNPKNIAQQPSAIKPNVRNESKGLQGNQITHQVILAAEADNPMTQKSFADKVKENLRSIPIKNIIVTKDGSGIINFPNKISRDDAFSNLKNNFNVKINNRPQRTVLPKVTILDVDSTEYKNKDSQKLKEAICEKNPTLKALVDQGKTFEILFIKEDIRKNNLSFAVAKVSKEVYNEIRSLNYQLYIDFQRCRVSNRVHVTQCYQCQKFGHTKTNCKSDVQVCRFCSGNHISKSCPVKGNIDSYKCANCDSNHSTTYYKCPVLQSQTQFLINRTQGMEEISKNDLHPHVIVT